MPFVHRSIRIGLWVGAVIVLVMTPEVALAQSEAVMSMHTIQGRRMSREQATALEQRLEEDGDNFIIRAKLLGFYGGLQFQSSTAKTAWVTHALWIVSHRPKSILAAREARFDQHIHRKAFLEAEDIWNEHLAREPDDTAILGNVANFYTFADRPRAIELLQHARDLDPENPEWSQRIGHMYKLELKVDGEIDLELARKSLAAFEEALKKTDQPMRRYYLLKDVAKSALYAREIEKAKRYATELLDSAVEGPSDWNYGNAVHHGNLILGRIALMEDDLKKAGVHLIRAGKTPGSPQLNSFGPNMLLAKELLKAGKKEVVIEYLELCGKFWSRGELGVWITDINEDRMPDFGANTRY